MVGNLLFHSSHFCSLLFTLLLKIPHFKEQLRALCSCGSLKRVTVSKSFMSLFKKMRPWANRSCCTLLKRSKWFALFHEQIAFMLTKNERFAQKNYIFCMFLTVFPLFYAQKQITPIPHYKRMTITLYKIAMWMICSFSQVNFLLFGSQKTSNLLKKLMSKFSTMVFEKKLKKFCISLIVPRGTANNMQMHKIWKSKKLTHPIVYTLHKNLYSL